MSVTRRLQKNSGTGAFKRYLPEFLVVGGFVLMAVSASHWILRYRSLSFNQQLVDQYQQDVAAAPSAIERPPEPVHIYSQWFLDIGIEPQIFADDHWTISEDQASHLAQSARPGEAGNIIIYGHNKREILGNIRAFKGSELITLKTADGQDHYYRITGLHEVEPNQVQFLEPTQTETLTLYTCSGLLDSKRFIVRAEPWSEGEPLPQ